MIVKRDGSIVSYNRRRIVIAIAKAAASTGKADPAMAEAMAEKVETALIGTYGDVTRPSVEDIQDVVESVLIENRLTALARNYIVYRSQRAMARAARACEFEVTDNVPYKKLYEVLRWNIEHQCDSVLALNALIVAGRFPQLVQDSNRRYDDEIALGASRILGRLGDIRIAIVAGPSSSGKTTTTHKMGEHLRKAGIRLKSINIDNYFFDLDQHPKDEFGDYDYETPRALDLDLIDRHLAQLLDGRTIRMPRYNFKTGRRTLDVDDMSLAKDEILLIDSLHGLCESMTRSIPAQNKFKLYIETLGQFRAADGTFMRWADNRLLRRMIRDKQHRNLQPMQTLTHWHYVRKSELEYIIPFIKHADFVVNTALPYELPLLKHRLFRYFSRAIDRYRDDSRRLDAHIRANRVYDLLKSTKAVKDDRCVPPDSLLREFIGGSSYKY